MSDYTIGEIAAAHGEKVRTVQFWADSGVIQPIEGTGRKGKGTQRRFSDAEMRLAGLAKRLAAMNCPVGELVQICDIGRSLSVSQSLNSALKTYEEIRDRRAEKSISFAEMVEGYFSVMGRVGLAGIFTGKIKLVINYYYDGGEVKNFIHFMNVDEDGGLVSRWRGPNYIGYKSLDVDVEQDLRFRYSPTPEEHAGCALIYHSAKESVAELMEGFLEFIEAKDDLALGGQGRA